ncbi:ABC transporter substrate-binding protein [Mesorhizobium sp. M2A.F.Ca.ET.043.05.1.1]|uniref:ABC transporter substrate-binding protein n=1 Tax=Mesorhizobium sp. M2A.F.Ca.ET.043.05.1.1 TaxID=2493671 RepID=UPI000F752920|nr:ABC transporter substrate-binding protein [Mesorhizobium sp. M2A.F.Ca.ET.043.05.1.1]AZO18057.1 ABC transporter substrate-binding protein [Mesorhizobium sp. M2A.F.Ca.ET.043.05.1.1]
MTISRRDVFKMGIAAGTALSIPSVLRAQTAAIDGRTVRMVMDDLRIFDPILSTDNITYDHGLAIYDTLFAIDSKLVAQPQMVGKWSVSEDKKTYTFELRDGLSFHDGSPVTAGDCVASIRRWGQAASGGQLIMSRAKDVSKKDAKTFTIVLNEPLGLLIDILASPGGLYLPIMREKDANRPATEQVTSNIGSGPFKFNETLAKPGASFTYDRNESYVPRNEPPDGFGGGKIVKVDRAVWEHIADEQTAVAALQAGEFDFLYAPPADLYPVIESDPNLELTLLNKAGDVNFVRMNFLHKPFDNVNARRAMLHLVDQEAFSRIMAPDPKYGHTATSIFGNDTLYSNDENTGWYKKGGDPEKARQLFQEAGYAGEKVVILQPTDWAQAGNASQLLATSLRKIGVNAELRPMAWAELAASRANKGTIENGGWNIFISNYPNYSLSDPISTGFLLANGDKAWYGWPKEDQYEALRAKWADIDTLAERKALAREMQRVWWDFVGSVLLCQTVRPNAHRKTLNGLMKVPVPYVPMWNMQKV